MEMTTRTQLQTHFSRLLDLASQPSPPVKPTFWDKLDVDCRQASVDQGRSWKFKNGSAWDSIGPVKDEWNRFIYPRAIKPLLRDNTRMVYKNVKKQTPYSVCCWMIGKDWDSSHPAAIIICGNKRVTENAVKLIEGHGELGRTWGFQVYGYDSKISITMGESANENDDDSPLCAISGTRFAVGSRDFISTRTATLGGSIEIDGEYFGVTVAHPFLECTQYESSDDDMSDMSDDDGGLTDSFGHTEEAPNVTLESDAAFVEEPGSYRRRMLGAIPDSNRSKYFSQGADYALLKLRPADLAINLIPAGRKFVVPSRISRSSEGELWAAVSPVNPVQTKASPSICGLFIPHVGMQDVWALNMKPMPGYSGSWVVNASAQAISGILVSGSEANDVSYALPAHVVFEEIYAHFPKMRLQSLEQIADLPVPAFVEVIRKAEELGLAQFVSEIVWRRSPLNERHYARWTPLSWAIMKGYEAAVASLLEAGAGPLDSVATSSMTNPLLLAVQNGHATIVKLLISAGADPNHQFADYSNTPLAEAACLGHLEVVDILIAKGADVNKKGRGGRTPLMEALSFHIERFEFDKITRLLLENGAEVDCVDDDGITPLLLAAESDNPAILKLLIEKGADINKKGFRGHTPLMRAVVSRHEISARVLLDHGADVHCVDDDGITPLLLAAEIDNPTIIQLLIQNGADINQKDLRGQTPLLKAVSSCYEISASVLLDYWADVDCVDEDGTSPLLLAAGLGDPTIVQLLIERGARVNASTKDGTTPLLRAMKTFQTQEPAEARIDRDEIIRMLLEYGADPNCKDEKGNTPLSLAIRGGHDSTVGILLKHSASREIPDSLHQKPRFVTEQNEHIAHLLATDFTGLDDEQGSVCPPAPSNSPVREPKRTACYTCRANKVRCDREKPQCHNCRRLGNACFYPSDKTDNDKILSPFVPLPSDSLSVIEPAEESKQKGKRSLRESSRHMDESMAELDVEYRRIYRRTDTASRCEQQ
ncbi:Ankyrin repeat domain-containing protein 50 [Penicillium rolfsii]|nr:Ankyrin repeat domain-containing protein 50 [Penicillium rolfsii]